MDPFQLRDRLVARYAELARSFQAILAPDTRNAVDRALDSGLFWPEPHLSLNPSFESGGLIDDLVREGLLHEECTRIFRRKSNAEDPGSPLRLHRHQPEAIRAARARRDYVVTTGTGSGKSLAYIVPIVDLVLRGAPPGRIHAIVVYPMNAWPTANGRSSTSSSTMAFPAAAAPSASPAIPARTRPTGARRSRPIRRTSCSPTM